MNRRRGRLLAWGSVVGGLVVLVAGGVATKDWIVEEWYLRQFESGDLKEQRLAAERLAEMGSLRVLPRLFQRFANGTVHRSELQTPGFRSNNSSLTKWANFSSQDPGEILVIPEEQLRLLQTALQAAVKKRAEATVPCLLQGLRHENWYIRQLAACSLGELGAKAITAEPALEEALRDRSEVVRDRATNALRRIRGAH
jgi:HEAT repeat protein